MDDDAAQDQVLIDNGAGLSIDMLDADRLRVWADKLSEHGPNVSHFASVTWMQGELERLSRAIIEQVRDVGRLRAALARRPTDAEQAQWRPIETAPKDGTRIICWGPTLAVAECEWRKEWFLHPEGWYRSNQHPKVEPTHWMPLPAAPTGETEAPRHD